MDHPEKSKTEKNLTSGDLDEQALFFHRYPRPGKLEIQATKPLGNQRDLALAYSPGVAAPCLAIRDNPEMAAEYTSRANLVAVISNGTAVLGLGNIGPLASKPVMASGIDMSARMISLAINIAVMGFILVSGVFSHLENVLPATLGPEQLRAMAERISAGNIASLPDLPANIIRDALVEGFGWVMLYGGLGAWLLATASFLVFGSGKIRRCAEDEACHLFRLHLSRPQHVRAESGTSQRRNFSERIARAPARH